jgi:hypothetical protein
VPRNISKPEGENGRLGTSTPLSSMGTKHCQSENERRSARVRYLQPWHTGVRAAKYPKVNSPEATESVSMKKPCAESIR